MPNWSAVLEELSKAQRAGASAIDIVRRKYLAKLSKHTGRNVIAYYSAWLQRPDPARLPVGIDINDDDKNGFMNAIHGMDRTKGLDVLLHTPGGAVTVTESLVDYLRQMFGSNIRAVVPQIAMSAGTMIACSCKSVLMGKQSSLGPIDPQFGGFSTKGVLEEFERAKKEASANPSCIPIWQVIISKYHPTFIGQCDKAYNWSKELVKRWLAENMLKDEVNPSTSAEQVADLLLKQGTDYNHGKHISADEARGMGLIIENLEDDNILQDLVLTVHHAYMHTFQQSPAIKIIENHKGSAIVLSGRTV